MLTGLTPPGFSSHSDWVLRQEPEQRFVRSIAVFWSTVLAIFQFLGALRDGTVGITCHEDPMCRNEQGVLVPPALKDFGRIDKIRTSWPFKGSSHNPVGLAVVIAISTEMDWTGLALLDTSFPYFCGKLARVST